jgi:uncharacterized membrane protein YdbT with pleckstrin-like domain
MQPAYDASPAMFRNHPLWFLGAVLLIAAFGLGILVLLYWYIKVRSVRLTLDGDVMHLSRGIFSKDQIDLGIPEISTVRIRQTFWQRLFGVGAIEVFTSGDVAEISLEGMPNPSFVRDYVRSRSQGRDLQGTP